MYSNDLKNRAIFYYKNVLSSIRKVAKIFGIGKSTLARWIDNKAIVKKNRQSKISRILQYINSIIQNKPFITSDELSRLVFQNLKINVSKTTCWRAIRKNNFTRKRTRTKVSRKSNSQEAIAIFKDNYKQAKNIIAIDETFFYISDKPIYGYSKKGDKLYITSENWKRRTKITLYMAISNNKIIGYKLTDKHGNASDYLAFLKSLQIDSNNTILMDNVAFHKTSIVRQYLSDCKVNILFTPPYSPDYNPIENAFSKIKTYYRKLAIESFNMIDNIKASLSKIRYNDLQAYFDKVKQLVS